MIDQVLADVATSERYDRLAQLVAHYLTALDPDGPEPDPTENRSLHVTRHADGSRSGRYDLDPVGGEKLDTALEAILQAGRCAGDTRTRPQQLADALVQLADLALAGGGLPTLRTVKPHVLITLTAEDLTATATGTDRPPTSPGAGGLALPGTGQTGFGALLSTAEIRHLACDSMLTRILQDPDGIPIHHGRTQRVASPSCAASSSSPTSTASSPAARPRTTGATSTTSCTGSTAERPAGELRPALRTPPHPGPPRLPDRERPRRPMAHLPPRRHRNPDLPAPAHLSPEGLSAQVADR